MHRLIAFGIGLPATPKWWHCGRHLVLAGPGAWRDGQLPGRNTPPAALRSLRTTGGIRRLAHLYREGAPGIPRR